MRVRAHPFPHDVIALMFWIVRVDLLLDDDGKEIDEDDCSNGKLDSPVIVEALNPPTAWKPIDAPVSGSGLACEVINDLLSVTSPSPSASSSAIAGIAERNSAESAVTEAASGALDATSTSSYSTRTSESIAEPLATVHAARLISTRAEAGGTLAARTLDPDRAITATPLATRGLAAPLTRTGTAIAPVTIAEDIFTSENNRCSS